MPRSIAASTPRRRSRSRLEERLSDDEIDDEHEAVRLVGREVDDAVRRWLFADARTGMPWPPEAQDVLRVVFRQPEQRLDRDVGADRQRFFAAQTSPMPPAPSFPRGGSGPRGRRRQRDPSRRMLTRGARPGAVCDASGFRAAVSRTSSVRSPARATFKLVVGSDGEMASRRRVEGHVRRVHDHRRPGLPRTPERTVWRGPTSARSTDRGMRLMCLACRWLR